MSEGFSVEFQLLVIYPTLHVDADVGVTKCFSVLSVGYSTSGIMYELQVSDRAE